MKPAFTSLFALMLGACASQSVDAPTLAPRASEAIDPRLPVEALAQPGPADPVLASNIDRLLAEARIGDDTFMAAVPATRSAAASAGPIQSESWVVAQAALARLERLRTPVTNAAADIDQESYFINLGYQLFY